MSEKTKKIVILSEVELRKTISRLTCEIIEKVKKLDNLLLVGIPTRGIALAEVLEKEIFSRTGLRIKKGSSDGGHNGIKSTNRVLDPEDYYKLKVGVGRPPQGIDPADFVLSKFYNDEREEVEFLIEDSVDILTTFLKDKELAIKDASERRIIDVI